jgi:hypothetical protein
MIARFHVETKLFIFILAEFKWTNLFSFQYPCRQRLAVWLVADFEALPYQVKTTFDTSCAARIRTAPAINYTACVRPAGAARTLVVSSD